MAGRHWDAIGEILIAHKAIEVGGLKQAQLQVERSHEPLHEVLVRRGLITEAQLVKTVAASLGVSAWDLQKDPPAQRPMGLLDAKFCASHDALPVQRRGDLLLLAMANPQDLGTIEMVRQITGLRIEPVLVYPPRLKAYLDSILSQAPDDPGLELLVAKAMSELDGRQLETGEDAFALQEIDTRPVVGLVNQILTEGIRIRASDIHIEPQGRSVQVRYRLDGQLFIADEFPAALLPMVVARIKIMTELDIVEFRMPQDGRLSAKLDGRDIDLRVSVLPSHHGPRVVLRILDRSSALLDLGDLGISDHNLGLFKRMIRKPHGMILVTGPTGSGKTTTLYAALNSLKSTAMNIMTCEDPIEYELAGVNQSQVNEKVGLTFGTQLRAILRQDPDVVLVGEIRDLETAEIAVRASMTGHLVLSTLHTNDALSALPRLEDIGVKPFLVSTSLIGVMAQRLVRKLCTNCCRPSPITDTQRATIESITGNIAPHALMTPVGCSKCRNTGYRGRIAVSELVPVTHTMQHEIARGASMDFLRDEALRNGWRPMQLDALERVIEGTTSFEEAERVVFFEEPASDLQLRVA